MAPIAPLSDRYPEVYKMDIDINIKYRDVYAEYIYIYLFIFARVETDC